MKDRFGALPLEVDELFNGLRVRWIAKKMGFERVILKNGSLKCFFVSNPQSSFFETRIFQSLLQYISTTGAILGLTLNEGKNFLIMGKSGVKNLKEARVILERIYEDSVEKSKSNYVSEVESAS